MQFVLLFTILTVSTPPSVVTTSAVFNTLTQCRTAATNHSNAIRSILPTAKIVFTCQQSL
jgi:hypothetical protein